MLECVFLPMVPNFVGSAGARYEYESGERPLDGADMTAAFAALEQLRPYLAEDFMTVSVVDAQARFIAGESPLIFEGSWNADMFTVEGLNGDVFSAPPPKGNEPVVVFQSDIGVAMNAATANVDACREFLAWLATRAAAESIQKNFSSGFFSMSGYEVAQENPYAVSFFELAHTYKTDERFIWPKLMDLYNPMNDAVLKVLEGGMTPEDAAGSLAAVAR